MLYLQPQDLTNDRGGGSDRGKLCKRSVIAHPRISIYNSLDRFPRNYAICTRGVWKCGVFRARARNCRPVYLILHRPSMIQLSRSSSRRSFRIANKTRKSEIAISRDADAETIKHARGEYAPVTPRDDMSVIHARSRVFVAEINSLIHRPGDYSR